MLLKQLSKKKNVSPIGHANGCVTSLIFFSWGTRSKGLFASVEQAQPQIISNFDISKL